MEKKDITIKTYKMIKCLKTSQREEVQMVIEEGSGTLIIRKIIQAQNTSYLKMKHLYHRYLPEIIDVWEVNGTTIVLEEFIKGSNLGQVLQDEGALKPREVMRIGLQLCEVLGFLHKKKIIHRDIKPDNIIITAKGTIKLIDFDAARQVKEEASYDTQYLGTRGYAPPEQYGFAQTDRRTDIYALGVTLKELLGSRYKGRLLRAISKCMQIDPAKRYKNIDKVRYGLKRSRYPVVYSIWRFNYYFGCVLLGISGLSIVANIFWGGDDPPKVYDQLTKIPPAVVEAIAPVAPEAAVPVAIPEPPRTPGSRDLIPTRTQLSGTIEVSDYFGGSIKEFSEATGVALTFLDEHEGFTRYICPEFVIIERDKRIYGLQTQQLSQQFSYYGLDQGFNMYFTDYRGRPTMKALKTVLAEEFDFYKEEDLLYAFLQKETHYLLMCHFDETGNGTQITVTLDGEVPYQIHREVIDSGVLVSEDLALFEENYQSLTRSEQKAFTEDKKPKRVIWTGTVEELYPDRLWLSSGGITCNVYPDGLYRDVAEQLSIGDKIKVEGLLSDKPSTVLKRWLVLNATIEKI